MMPLSLPALSVNEPVVPLKVVPLSMLFQFGWGTTPATSPGARLSAGEAFRPMKLTPMVCAQLEPAISTSRIVASIRDGSRVRKIIAVVANYGELDRTSLQDFRSSRCSCHCHCPCSSRGHRAMGLFPAHLL